MFRALCLAFALSVPAACTSVVADSPQPAVMRWDHRPEAQQWTAASIRALQTHGATLPATVPADIETFCPDYEDATIEERQLFWTALLSALARYESTWNPQAAGGGGRWIGLLQISPQTARAHGCAAQDAAALKDGSANLSCAIRIMSRTVARDGVVGANGRGGIAADWGPFTQAAKRNEMAAWTRSQPYCKEQPTVLAALR